MALTHHQWIAVRTVVGVTLAATAMSFMSIWVWMQIDPVMTIDRAYVAAIGIPLLIAPVCSMVIQRAQVQMRELSDENQYLANHDDLTGLSNRRAFFARAGALHAGMGARGEVFACAIADIDNFKRINDSLGHHVGDDVLRSLSGVLAHLAPKDSVVARLGGEEFAMAGHFANASVARLWFEALVREVAFRRPGGHDVTVSLGWCVGQEGETLSALLTRADRALYASKAAGKNRAEMAERDMLRVVA